jgi:alkane 1-monooxygenase
VWADLASFWSCTGLVLSLGIVNGGVGVSSSHELFHSRGAPLAHALAFVLLTASAYAPFYFMHRHHHINVATPLDGATARKGEPFVWFFQRSALGGLRDSWRHEQRVRRGAVNRVAVALVLPVALTVFVLAAATWCATDFESASAFATALSRATQCFLAQAVVGILTVEMGNYLQHYGMVRGRSQLDPARFERVQAHHSWDCDLIAFNFSVSGVAQHSHHHVEPGLPLGSLRPQAAPSLPHDYFALYWMVAWTPFRLVAILDARLDAFKQLELVGDVGDGKLADRIDYVGQETDLDMVEGIL